MTDKNDICEYYFETVNNARINEVEELTPMDEEGGPQSEVGNPKLKFPILPSKSGRGPPEALSPCS